MTSSTWMGHSLKGSLQYHFNKVSTTAQLLQQVKRNSAYGSSGCLPSITLSLNRSSADQLTAKINPEFELDNLELWGVKQLAWGKEPDQYDNPTNSVYVSFTAKKEWLPKDTPVAATIGRHWDIPGDAGLLGSTLIDSIESKYGPRSDASFEKRNYGRDGKNLSSLSCPESVVQEIPYNFIGDSERGESSISTGCGVVLDIYIGTDFSTGRASTLKMRMADSDLHWKDFWSVWSHEELSNMQVLYDGLFKAAGKGPAL
jgi:hypothetical protein